MREEEFKELVDKLKTACESIKGKFKEEERTCVVKDKKVSVFVPLLQEGLSKEAVTARVEFPDGSIVEVDVKDIKEEENVYEDAEGRLYRENWIKIEGKRGGVIKVSEEGKVEAWFD